MAKVRTSDDDAPPSAYSDAKSARPTLIERTTNEWQKEAVTLESGGKLDALYDRCLDRLDGAYDAVHTIIKGPKLRRLAAAVVLFVVFGWLMWVRIVRPWVQEERTAREIFNSGPSETTLQIGTNAQPRLGLIQTKELESKYLPGGPKAAKSRRLIFVGDIHGCKKELLELLVKVNFNEHTDHIVSVGDIVTKGPDSLGVIDFLMEKKATVVRGNHDDKVIILAERHRKHQEDESAEDGIEAQKKTKHHKKSHKAIARALTDQQLEYMQSFPLILKVGPLNRIGEMLVVHAGLVPGVPLEHQDPSSIMNMRSIDLRTHVPSKRHHDKHSRPWFKIWGKYQKLLTYAKKHKKIDAEQLTVVYGHDAKMGLQVSRFSKGLDSNCARGGHLTALVVNEHGKEKTVQVSCRKDYTLDS